jgi:mono/diheme cytochrome c family protein
MRFGLAAAVTAGVWVVGASVGAQTPAKTTWDGVFTADQAKRGEATYAAQCSSCHGPDLSGDGFAPPLTGTEFSSNWGGLTVGDLFDRIRISMPPSNPGSVTADQKADILAYLFDQNKFPAGMDELKGDVAALKQIAIKTEKP